MYAVDQARGYINKNVTAQAIIDGVTNHVMRVGHHITQKNPTKMQMAAFVLCTAAATEMGIRLVGNLSEIASRWIRGRDVDEQLSRNRYVNLGGAVFYGFCALTPKMKYVGALIFTLYSISAYQTAQGESLYFTSRCIGAPVGFAVDKGMASYAKTREIASQVITFPRVFKTLTVLTFVAFVYMVYQGAAKAALLPKTHQCLCCKVKA